MCTKTNLGIYANQLIIEIIESLHACAFVLTWYSAAVIGLDPPNNCPAIIPGIDTIPTIFI